MTKIATCCYCGTRAALVLRGKERHELACSNCGAPLHDLKMLRTDGYGRAGASARSSSWSSDKPRRKQKKPRKKQKSLKSRFLEEAWDVIEDIFD